MKNIVSFSGGKDSTAMLLMMLEKNMDIDEVIFIDTGMEFEVMYKHIDKIEKETGIKITRLKSEKTFEYFLFKHKKTRGNHTGDLGYGFPRMFKNRWCTYNLKTKVYKKYLKEKYKDEELKTFIGIAYDEKKRIKNDNYPLVDWEITESMALKYCYDKGYDWDGLYEIFDRVSCWCCPQKSLKELKKLYFYFPEKWDKLKEWEKKTYNNFREDYDLQTLEKRFNDIEDRYLKNVLKEGIDEELKERIEG